MKLGSLGCHAEGRFKRAEKRTKKKKMDMRFVAQHEGHNDQELVEELMKG